MPFDSVRPWRAVHRRTTTAVAMGKVRVGGDAMVMVHATLPSPITHMPTTHSYITECVEVGADVVCVPCATIADVQALRHITPHSPVPIIAHIVNNDIKLAIAALAKGADSIKIAVNTDDISPLDISPLLKSATAYNRCIIAVFNVDAKMSSDAVIKDMLHLLDSFEKQGFYNTILSVHTDDIFLLYAIYMDFAFTCRTPIHLSLAHYGTMMQGAIQGAMVLGNLLWAGIGDILHVALNTDPVQEVKTAYAILKSLGLRHRGVNVISCPSCARQAFDVVQTVTMLEQRLEHISTPLTLSVLGCIVNGIGEAQHTDIGFIGGGKNTHQVYMNGLPSHRLQDEDLIQHIVGLVEQKAAQLERQKRLQPLATQSHCGAEQG